MALEQSQIDPASAGKASQEANGSSSPKRSLSTQAAEKLGEKIKRPSFELTKPVFFVGFMGAGKTTVSRRLARMCKVTSIDIDTYLERREGVKISELFATRGEAVFRSLETQLLEELSQADPSLVSCGGGVVLSEENRSILKKRGFVVYLQVSADEAAGRISDISTRPLFKDIETARDIIAVRVPLYEEAADATVDTSGKNARQIAVEVRDILRREGILWPVQK